MANIKKRRESTPGKIKKVLKVGGVPATATALLATGVIVPATVFATNAIGVKPFKSRELTTKQYASIYGAPNWKKYISMKQDVSLGHKGTFLVNNRPTKIWKLKPQDGSLDKATKAILFIHGLRNSHYNAITFAREAFKHGYVVYAYDQRESGENIDNGKISFGQNEADDFNNFYQVIVNQVNNQTLRNVIVYGQSNGAGTTLSFAEKHKDTVTNEEKRGVKTDFLIESGFVSGHKAMDGLINGFTGGKYLSWMVTPQMKSVMNDFMQVDADYDYSKHIRDFDQKLYIAHGSEDKVIPVDQAKILRDSRIHIDGNEDRPEDKHMKSITKYHEWKGLGHIGISLSKNHHSELFDEAIPWIEGSYDRKG